MPAPNSFSKYQALGNDYLVISPASLSGPLTSEQVQAICHRSRGVGSDGILLGPLPSQAADFGLRIFNPDGSEAEKSGNGLRIFARCLWDLGLVVDQPFTVETPGGVVACQVLQAGRLVRVAMGQVSFWSPSIPVAGEPREVLLEDLTVGGQTLAVCAATIGNPHCVIPLPEISPALAQALGPQIENHPLFPRRTNVQFLQILDPENIRIEIWERGAGYTLASGSSSCAAAAVARRLGYCSREIQVHCPGGVLQVVLDDDFNAVLTGPVAAVCRGVLSAEIWP